MRFIRILYFVMVMMAMMVISSCHQNSTEDASTESDSVTVADSLEDDSLYEDEEEVEPLNLPEGRDEAFSDFIFSFMRNRRFQAERIKFPLVVTKDGKEQRQIKSGLEFRKEFRQISTGYYVLLLGDRSQMEILQNDLSLSDILLNSITLPTLQQSSFHFLRTKGKWSLIEEKKSAVDDNFSDFLGFYNRFTTDSVFQQQSLAPQIKFVTPDPSDELSTIEGTLEPNQWPAFRPELPKGTITSINFGQKIDDANHIILLQCGISNGLLNVFTFQKSGNDWKLVSFEN